MEDDVIQRIRKILKSEGLSITALSKLVNIPQATLNRQISGESAMTLGTIVSILTYFKDISAEWLIRGNGEMNIAKDTLRPKYNAEVEIDNEGYLKIKIKK